jgi:NADH dehydrogenase (ubiquinone) flavoprotein 2
MRKPFDLNAAYQPKSFEFSKANQKKVGEIIALYPKGRQKSAVMPLLDLAQRQIGEEGADATPPYGGWIPRAAMDHIAETLEMAPVRVYEVATFYSMYNLAPVGKYLVQVCTTTPCWLCGSSKIVQACEDHLGIHAGETTKDGKFSVVEVECLGACVNAPMVQINDDFYEDLTADNMKKLLDILSQDGKPQIGPQQKRTTSMPAGGATTLKAEAAKAGVK